MKHFFGTQMKYLIIYLLTLRSTVKGKQYDIDNSVKRFFLDYADVDYETTYGKTITSKKNHKWVGAQSLGDLIVCIPSDENVFLLDNGLQIDVNCGIDFSFKWTGGCTWADSIICFPRSSNDYLLFNGKETEFIHIPYDYGNKEHHYGGVRTDNGIIYQPPRNSNHIIRFDIKKGEFRQIQVIPKGLSQGFMYCGSIIHPNGLIYFLPQNNRVIVLDPETDRWSFIGRRISGMVYDAKVGIDGNIYGYSAYGRGLLRINVIKEKVEMIHKEYEFGSYGTKYGINGLLYGIPGDGRYIWSYDPVHDKLRRECDIGDSTKAKYAGGVVKKNGTIVCVPANSQRILFYVPKTDVIIPSGIYKNFFEDNY